MAVIWYVKAEKPVPPCVLSLWTRPVQALAGPWSGCATSAYVIDLFCIRREQEKQAKLEAKEQQKQEKVQEKEGNRASKGKIHWPGYSCVLNFPCAVYTAPASSHRRRELLVFVRLLTAVQLS